MVISVGVSVVAVPDTGLARALEMVLLNRLLPLLEKLTLQFLFDSVLFLHIEVVGGPLSLPNCRNRINLSEVMPWFLVHGRDEL